jgi:6-phosphofructokinase 1
VPFDVDRLADLVVRDKESNPSRYAMVTVSEGAAATSGELVLSGEADAFGHRKLGGIGQLLGEALRERTGEDIIYQQLAYLMRSGSPDSLDLMVATNYAVMAADLALEGDTGRMVSLRNGTYTTVPVSAVREGVRRVDVDELYDADEYRPKVRHVLGKPMFLY